MPRKPQKSQHKRSPAQQGQIAWMSGLRRHHPSQNEAEAFQSQNPSPDANNRHRLMQEVAEKRRKRLNSEGEEKQVREEVGELKEKIEELEKAAGVKSDEGMVLRERIEDSEE